MLTLTLASVWQVTLMVVFIPLSLLLCLIILIQKPKGGGLSGAFGGAGGGSQVFGGKSGDILTWITVGFFVAFMLVGILLVQATKSDVMAGRTGTPQVEGEEAQEGPGLGEEKPAGDGSAPLPDLTQPAEVPAPPAQEPQPLETPSESPAVPQPQ